MTSEELAAIEAKIYHCGVCAEEVAADLIAEVKRLRIELWARISPSSNLHSDACPYTCRKPEHFPDSDPLGGYGLSAPSGITTEVLEKIDEALRCEATTTDGIIGSPPIECFLPRGHYGHHRTKENGEWTWEF